MYVAELTMTNWLPFAGTQHIEFEPTTYAVVASVDGDYGRSNWSGKTAFFEAPAFALFGDHRKRTEDEWITDGAEEGGVVVVLSQGTRISRKRKRGGTTVLQVRREDGVNIGGAEAQHHIESVLGLTKDDYYSMSHFKQKQLAAIVSADPGVRATQFARWLRLERLSQAEAVAQAERKRLNQEYDMHRTALFQLTQRMAQALGEDGYPKEKSNQPVDCVEYVKKGCGLLKFAEKESRRKMDAANVVVQTLFAEARKAQDSIRIAELAKQRAGLQAQVATMKAKLVKPKQPRATDKLKIESLHAKRSEIAVVVKNAKDSCGGKFDGICPVNGMDCPAKEKINTEETITRTRLLTAQRELEQVTAEWNAAKVEFDTGTALVTAYERDVSNIALLENRIREMPIPNNSPVSGDVLQRYQDAQTEYRNACVDHDRTVQLIEEWEQGPMTIDELFETMGVIERSLKVVQAAQYIFSKQGAQRRIAERVMRVIQNDGNRMLSEEGIDLRFELSWARTGSGLATVCTACGAAYPKSERVKRCGCGAERGPLVVEKSDVLMSDRSGAAEDMVGGVIRLATSSWFRTARESEWAVALVDEPFGSLDESNREMFSRLLKGMLSARCGIEQAFVTAHSPEVLAELPETIHIRRSGKLSTIGG